VPEQPAPAAVDITDSAGYRRMLVALMFGGLANFSLLYFVQPLLPLLVDQYDVTPAESAHALSITTAALTVGLLMAGSLADRFGRVQVMRASLVLSGVLGLAAAIAPTWPVLLIVRGLVGVTLAWFPAAALAYLREAAPREAHGHANAAYIAGTAVGGAVGRLLPGPLAALGGWTTTATAMSLLTLVSGVALWVLLPVPTGWRPKRAELRHILLGTVLAPSDAVIAWLCVAGFTSMGAFVAIYNAAAFQLQAPPFSLGHAVGWVYFAYPIGIAAPYLLRRVAERRGRGTATLIGALGLPIAVLLTPLPSVVGMFAALGLLTFAFLGTHSLLSGWVVDRAARRHRGTAQASSAYLLAYYLGSTIAGAVATWLWQGAGWNAVEILGLALTGLTIVAVVIASIADRAPQTSLDAQPTHV
jgi:YNFM family putative membrane transporter